ncbi:MAG TPA: cell division protein FtsZ [Dissulfurispiraceae bacterium]|nr:cell division protein FtsZ [Dissulfurispiraceae bacterium]
MFELQELERPIAKLKVAGVGGGGGNAINSMIAANIFGVEFIAINTDKQHLEASLAPIRIQIGSQVTRGLGAGADPELGRLAATEDRTAIAAALEGADMVFITAGMGGGTGTGASPVVAAAARELGIITVGVVTRPFFYEGKKRAMRAEEGVRELRQNVDTLIVIPNDRINAVAGKGTPLLKSFAIANDVLRQAIQGISDLILIPGLINLDFADVKAIMQNGGRAVIGVGTGKGEGGAFEAAKKAISNQLLEDTSIEGARGILINITGGINMPLDAVQEAASLIHESSADDANIILGAVINPDMEDEVRVTVIATGFEEKTEKAFLPNIKPWTPTKDPVKLAATDGILSKTMPSGMKSPDVLSVAPAHVVSQLVQYSPHSQPQTPPFFASTAADAAKSAVEPELPKTAKPQLVVSDLQLSRPESDAGTPPQTPVQPDQMKESLLPTEDELDIPTYIRKRL